MRKIMLFISSYIPLYILLIVKNILERCTDGGRFVFSFDRLKGAKFFDEINDFAIIFLMIFCVLSFFYLKKLLKRDEDVHYYTVKQIEDKTGNEFLNYISVYLLSCLGLSLNNIVDVFVLVFLMFVIGYIYISNHMTYMNPTLQFFGYKVYKGRIESDSTKKEINTIIVAKSEIDICVGKRYVGSGKQDFINITQQKNKV